MAALVLLLLPALPRRNGRTAGLVAAGCAFLATHVVSHTAAGAPPPTEEAALAYDSDVFRLRGDSARLNFPELRRGGQHLGPPLHAAVDAKLHAICSRELVFHRQRRVFEDVEYLMGRLTCGIQ